MNFLKKIHSSASADGGEQRKLKPHKQTSNFSCWSHRAYDFCKNKISRKPIVAEVKVPSLVGFHKKHFCSQEHYEAYQKYIYEYEKRRKIPESNCTVCAARMKK